ERPHAHQGRSPHYRAREPEPRAGRHRALRAAGPTPVAEPEAPATASPTDPDAVLDAVLSVVADRTGYPVEMIEPELDLEADLSVDSIKRAEIAGELAVRLGLPLDASGELDGLSTARTAAGITGLLVERLTGTGDTPPEAEAEAEAESAAADDGSPAESTTEAEILAPQRLEFTEEPLADVTGTITAGSAVLVLGGGELAPALADRLRAAGASPTLVPAGELPTATADAVVLLDTLDAQQPPLPDALPLFQAALAGAPGTVVAVERRTEGAASGLRGFFRSVAREYPDLKATLVEVAADATADAVSDAVVTELAATEREPVVLTDGGRRRALRLTPTDLGALAATGAGPAGEGQSEAEAAGLDRESVVLLVGGARGITARFARTIASASRCRVELMGRTPVPAPSEDPATAGATDRAGLRSAFLASV
ncbi:phosphopantetheine-binding protein, partial [Streptomyces niveus]|uniref:phosphopantetheine-binding protein n=1 Tax=Streptomyces niveus TaxID=193462 RepID=UPI0034480503